jgi:chromosome partitioning protein
MKDFTNTLTPMELKECLGDMTVQGVYKALKSHDINTENATNRRRYVSSSGVRKLLLDRGFTYPTANISFQIVKGGVGKTSLSFLFALRASHYGAKVLVIDFDQQGNLTRSFNVESRDRPVWINIFRDHIDSSEALVNIAENIDLIPSNLNNSRLDVELTQANVNLKDTVKDCIAKIRQNYDIVIMDCPPAINKINTTVTCASDLVLIPINPDPYAMDGLDFTISEMNRIKKDFKLNNDFRIIWNKYDARERLGTYYMHELAKNDDLFPKVMPVVCRIDASLRNSISEYKSVFDMQKKSSIKEDIDQLTREILGIYNWNESQKQKK